LTSGTVGDLGNVGSAGPAAISSSAMYASIDASFR
jgi:hypothetical protein